MTHVPSTMKAIACPRYGSSDVLQVREGEGTGAWTFAEFIYRPVDDAHKARR